MAEPPSQQPQANARAAHPSQAVTGVVPPGLGEARIREVRPTLMGVQPGAAGLARKLVQSVFLLPLGLLLQAPLFAAKFGPGTARRYTLTNRRLMVRHGLRGTPKEQVPLAEIDDVRLDANRVDPYYLSGDLEVISAGKVVLRLPAVPEPEGFRQAVLNAVKAWVPGKATGPWIPAGADVSGQAAKT